MLRRIKSLLGFYRGDQAGLDFYQYTFTETEIDSLIEKAGFKVINHFRYDAYKGVKEELPFLRNLLVLLKTHFLLSFRARHGIYIDSRFCGNDKVNNSIERPWWLKPAERYFGHMTMVVCTKE